MGWYKVLFLGYSNGIIGWEILRYRFFIVGFDYQRFDWGNGWELMVLIMVLLVVSLLKLIELMVLRMFFPVIVLSRMDVGSELGDLVGCEVLMRITGYCMLVDPFSCNTCSCWLVVKLKIKTICILPGTLDGIVHGPTQIMVRCGFPWLMKTRIPKTPAPQEPEVLRVQKQLQAPSLDPRISLRNLSGYVHFVFFGPMGKKQHECPSHIPKSPLAIYHASSGFHVIGESPHFILHSASKPPLLLVRPRKCLSNRCSIFPLTSSSH